MDRDSLLDGEMTPTRENPNVFDDEYEVQDGGFMADGLRPAQNHDREGSGRQDRDEDDQNGRLSATHGASSSMSSTPAAGPSRSSTRKSRGQQNPFASPEDGEVGMPLVRTPSGNFDTVRTSVSSASSSRFARTSSQRFGAGPSHPYNMYPQGTMARTPSVTTTSTTRPQRQSSSRQPQHPYAMYTQGVGDDLDDDNATAQNLVPVGFLGTGEHYQRRRGPDGEEQGLLGDFGHTEQLPPYTRYPEDGPEKAPLLDVPNPPGVLHSRAPVLGSDPGMDLMHTQIHAAPPAQQSMTDDSELYRQPSVASRRSLPASVHACSQGDTLLTEKTWSAKSWREKRKTRVCGVPCWWFILLTGTMVFIAAMLGGVIGGFVEGQRKGQAKALAQAAKTSLYDASIIVTATTSPPPATGTFALPLGTAQATQAACLTNPAQAAAWNCDLVGDVNIQIVIDTPPGSDQPGAYLTVDIEDQPIFSYGNQRSSMETTFSPFLLVTDNDAPGSGPAYYFNQQYNKLAIIHEEDLNKTTGTVKRDFAEVPDAWLNRKKYAGTGDRPWFCYWNGTFVEGFIYPNERAVPPAQTTTSSYPTPPPSTSMPAPTNENYSSSSSYSYSHPVTSPWSIAGAQPTETVTTTVIMPSTTCVYTGVASAFPSWMEDRYPGWVEVNGKAYPPGWGGDSDGSTYRKAKRGEYGSDYGYDYDGNQYPPQYPYVVKIEERRLPGSPHPYCNQVVVLNNWDWNWATDEEGNQITIMLTEQDPTYHSYVAEGEAGKKARLRKRKEVPGECHCQWQSGQG